MLLPRPRSRPNERRILTLDLDEKPGDPQTPVGLWLPLDERLGSRHVVLALLSLPIAMIANLARILLLMLGISYLGADAAAADGPLHQIAGLFMFLVSLACLIGLDAALTPLRSRLARA